jgi:hypothetical protein
MVKAYQAQTYLLLLLLQLLKFKQQVLFQHGHHWQAAQRHGSTYVARGSLAAAAAAAAAKSRLLT